MGDVVKKWTGKVEGSGNYYFGYSSPRAGEVYKALDQFGELLSKEYPEVKQLLRAAESELDEINAHINKLEDDEWNSFSDKTSEKLNALYKKKEEIEDKVSALDSAVEALNTIDTALGDIQEALNDIYTDYTVGH